MREGKLRCAAARSPYTRGEGTCATDESEDQGRIFGRIDAAGLRAEGESEGEQQSEGEGEKQLVHVHNFLEVVFITARKDIR